MFQLQNTCTVEPYHVVVEVTKDNYPTLSQYLSFMRNKSLLL
jgi:hypothetical protein